MDKLDLICHRCDWYIRATDGETSKCGAPGVETPRAWSRVAEAVFYGKRIDMFCPDLTEKEIQEQKELKAKGFYFPGDHNMLLN